MRYTVKEPPRGYSESLKQEVAAPGFWEVVGFIWRSSVLRHIVAAGALVSFTGYASVIWIPIYLVRIHGMGTGEVGSYLALLIGVGSAIGIYLGGRIADFMSGPPGRAVAALGGGVVFSDQFADALSDVYGVNANDGDCRLCVTGDVRHALCGARICLDPKMPHRWKCVPLRQL